MAMGIPMTERSAKQVCREGELDEKLNFTESLLGIPVINLCFFTAEIESTLLSCLSFRYRPARPYAREPGAGEEE